MWIVQTATRYSWKWKALEEALQLAQMRNLKVGTRKQALTHWVVQEGSVGGGGFPSLRGVQEQSEVKQVFFLWRILRNCFCCTSKQFVIFLCRRHILITAGGEGPRWHHNVGFVRALPNLDREHRRLSRKGFSGLAQSQPGGTLLWLEKLPVTCMTPLT